MSLNYDDEQHIKSYLLGTLAQEEMQALEERLLREQEFANQVLLIEDELTEDYSLGELSDNDRQQFEKYFLTTPRRRRKLIMVERLRELASVTDAGTTEQTIPAAEDSRFPKIKQITWWTRFFQPRWKLAAFAALALMAGFGIWRVFFLHSPLERGLVELNKAYKQERPLEARVTGMSYAPYSAKRGGEPENVDYRARDLSRSLLIGAASDNPNSATLHALGRLYMTQKEFDKAILQFQEALKSFPDDAQLHADLGAALLEQAKMLRDGNKDGEVMATLAESHGQLSTALRLNPSLAEASFNLALVLEAMMLPDQARQAWQKYLELDRQSEWSKEARRHLQSISEYRRPSAAEELAASFTAAFRERNETEAWRVLSANREVITGKMIPLRLAHDYVTHTLKGEEVEARETAKALVFAGELDKRMGGDPYTIELAAYYANASRPTLQLVSKAVEDVNQGYALCLATKYEDAAARFGSARPIFEQAGDEWESKLADYWIAYCLSQPGRTRDSNAILEPLAEFCRRRGYKWLLALTTGWLGGNHTALHEYSTAIKYNRESLALAEELSDTYEEQRALMSLGDLYARLRQREASLGYHYRTLALASGSGAAPRQGWRNLTYFGGALFAFKYYDAAASVINEAMPLSRTAFNDPSLLYLQYLNLGQIYSKLRRFDDATAQAQIGLDIARSVQDPNSRLKPVANAMLRQADIWREAGDCSKALANYGEAISTYEQIRLDLYRYAAYKGRLLCNLALGDDPAANRDLTTVLGLFEKQRSQIFEEENRNSFFDAEQDVYDIAVEYEYEKHNSLVALKYAEASRSRSLLDAVESGVRVEIGSTGPETTFGQVSTPADLERIRLHLPQGLRVFMYTVLQNKVLVWTISRDEFSVSEKDVAVDELSTDVNSYVKALTTERTSPAATTTSLGAKLFETLIRPVVKTIKSGEVICVIPDKFLYRLPFAALISPETGRYLVEDVTIFYAPSLNILWRCSEAAQTKIASAPGTILSIGNPRFDRTAHPDLPPLAEAETEARVVSEFYDRPVLLLDRQANKERVMREMDSAEVIHFAGHYVIDGSSPLMSKMLLAGGDLSAFEIVSQHLNHTKLAILSACQTGLDKYYDSEGPVGLARAFIAAGVPMVVASAWPVDSEVTAHMMINFHRNRRSGLHTFESLRRAQVEMLRGPDDMHRAPYYWAAFLSAGGYTEY